MAGDAQIRFDTDEKYFDLLKSRKKANGAQKNERPTL
jgi:hypothetical protein